MLPARVLTVGGSAGPACRADVLNAVVAFEYLYDGRKPRVLTVMPEALERMAAWCRGEAGPGDFVRRVVQNSRPTSPDPVQFCGLTLTVGPAYQLTD